jgi:DNA-binding XRE family transcriptional regulator
MSYIVNGKWPTLRVAHKIVHALNEHYGLNLKIEDIWPYEDMEETEEE